MLALGHLLLPLLLLQGLPLAILPLEGIVAAAPERELPVDEMDDRADRGVQEIAVMADHNDGMRIAREIALEPKRAFEVEVVGRLVEKEQVRLVEKERGERDAHAPASGEIRARARLCRGVEAEPGKDARGAGLGSVGADIGKPRVDLGDAVRVVGMLGFGEERRALAVGGEHRLKQRARAARRFLLDAADSRALGQRDRAGIGRNVAGDSAEKRRLPSAVPTNEPGLRARRQRQARALDQGAASNAKRQVGDLEHGPSV